MSKEKRRVIRYYLQIGTIMWGDNMSRITSYGKQSITDLLGKMNQAENAIDQADKTEDGKSTKKDKSKVFAGDLNLIEDPVTKKRKEAQQKALKVVKDAWDIDRSIDADIQEQRDHYDKMKTLYSEAQDEVLKINDQKKALREQHMVEPDSQEQKDLELLEKRQVCMSGKFNIELTEEEWKRCEEIDKAGLTNYQEQALELNKRSIHFRKELKEAQKGMKEDVAKIKAIRLERLKSDPMVEAEKNADQIMENASKEIIGLLKQEAIDNFNTDLDVRFSTYGVPMILGEVRRYLRDNSALRVSRAMRDTAYKVLQAKDAFMAQHQREPTVDEIAAILGIRREEIVFALDAIVDPVSLYEPVYSDNGDALCVMDQVKDSKNTDEMWVERIALGQAVSRLSDRERKILALRFFQGKTQMEVSAEIGISQAQVSRLEKNALRQIRKEVMS